MFKVVVLVGASASGKTTLMGIAKRYGCNTLNGVKTRPFRPKERYYHYKKVTPEWFLEEHQKGNILSGTIYDGGLIGTHIEEFDKTKVNVMLAVPANIAELKRRINRKHLHFVFIDATEDERRERLIKRGETEEEVERRIKSDKFTFRNAFHLTDYKITSTSTKEDARELISIIEEISEE